MIGTAALISVASVTQMYVEDKQKLGIAAGVGVVTSVSVSAFGVASTSTAISTLSGVAAYSFAMEALS